jgi:hypothetical protein
VDALPLEWSAPPPTLTYWRDLLAPRRPATPVGTLLHDAEREMRDPSSLDHPSTLQLDRFGAQVV